jgi:alkanesulfonate monooxygenase SsuD/methylene tetrahydromethanopterin reductase-like flavin-dependent oxidoreductase (luciferase family)
MHVLNHLGQNFSVRGPLNVNRSPQGKPILAHVLTDDTTWLAARQAEVLIVGDAPHAISTITGQLEQAGRSRSDIKIFENVTDFTAAPTDLADSMQRKFEAAKVDGFLLSPPTTNDFDQFCETVVPALRDRGLTHKEYSGLTLREYLGLHRPAHPAAQLERAS